VPVTSNGRVMSKERFAEFARELEKALRSDVFMDELGLRSKTDGLLSGIDISLMFSRYDLSRERHLARKEKSCYIPRRELTANIVLPRNFVLTGNKYVLNNVIHIKAMDRRLILLKAVTGHAFGVLDVMNVRSRK